MSLTAAELIARVAVQGAKEAAAQLGEVGASAEGAGSKLKTLAVGGLVIAGAALAEVGYHAVKAAADFETGLTVLSTGAGELKSNLQLVGTGIKQISIDTATSTDQLIKGMFNIESAGYHGQHGLDVLRVAAEGARLENADLGQTAFALTGILHDYGLKSTQASEAMNALIATESSGKMHMQDLTSTLGRVLPLASALGVAFPQVGAAIAVMTNANMTARNAANNLAFALRALAAPSGIAEKSMKAVGLSAQEVKDTLSHQGLEAAFQLIEDHVGKKFPANSVEAVKAFKNILGGASGYNVMLMLGGQHMKEYEQNIQKISKAMNDSKAAVEGWDQVQATFNFKLDQAKEAVNVLFINIGTALLPVLGKLADQVTPLIVQFSDWATKSGVLNQAAQGLQDTLSTAVSTIQTTATAVQTVVGFYQQWQFPINSVALSLSVFFIPSIIKAGVEALISSAKITYGLVASIIKVGIEGWTAGVKLTVLIASFIATQIEAAAAAAVVAGQFVASIAKVGVQAAITALTMDANLVPSIVLFASTALLSIGTAITPFVIALGVAATAAWTLAAAVLAVMWPILAAIAAIGLIVLAVNHWTEITNGFNSLWTQFTHNIEQSTHQMKTGVSTDIENMASRSKVAVGNASYDIEASTGRITHATKAMAKQTQIDFKDMDFWAVHNSTDLTSTAKRLFDNMTGHIKGDYSDLDQATKDYWNAIANYIDNKSLLAAQAAQRHFDSIHMPNLTGGQVGTLLHLNASGTTAGGNAEGTDNWRGGLTWVGEKGPELLNIPSGAQIIPNNKIGSVGSAPVIHNHIDVYLDGQRMTGQLMPRIVQQIRTALGAKF